MDILTIEGGVPLQGSLTVSGSKNAALPILIATLLTDEACSIQNVPHLDDIDTVVSLLTFLGKKITRQVDSVVVTAGAQLNAEAPYELVRRMRASVVVMGPLLARLKRVKVSLPGGCAIGGRPINLHLEGFRSLGAEVILDQGYVDVRASELKGATIHFDFPSVGATENLMMAACLIPGQTVLHNAAMEPEITDLANFLFRMGAQISGAGTDTITIVGVKALHGAEHRVIADRIEAGTFLMAGALPGCALELRQAEPKHLISLIAKLRQAGAQIVVKDDSLKITPPARLQAVGIETAVHPGFPTDLQAQWMALMTVAAGTSVVSERVFENRFMHVPELERMGARIVIRGNAATVLGVDTLSGADVMVSDLRAGAALVLAGLVAKGRTTIHRIYHLDRGYERIEQKLRAVGARVTRSKE